MLYFWKDGFSVDDGPLRTGDSEQDRNFIDAVRKGSVKNFLVIGVSSEFHGFMLGKSTNINMDHPLIIVCREIPPELLKGAQGGEVDVDITDRRDELYVKPKPKLVAFSGQGRKLGRSAT